MYSHFIFIRIHMLYVYMIQEITTKQTVFLRSVSPAKRILAPWPFNTSPRSTKVTPYSSSFSPRSFVPWYRHFFIFIFILRCQIFSCGTFVSIAVCSRAFKKINNCTITIKKYCNLLLFSTGNNFGIMIIL